VSTVETGHGRTNFSRLITIAAVFVLLGPFFGGLVTIAREFLVPLFAPNARLPFELLNPNAIVLLMIPSYIFGSGLALLAGIGVGLWRIWKGRTTVLTPVVLAVVVVMAALSAYSTLPDNSHLSSSPNSDFLKFFLPPSLIAAILCWFIVKKAELA
jgi:hypothetical protein